jgi:hypothetical protein
VQWSATGLTRGTDEGIQGAMLREVVAKVKAKL